MSASARSAGPTDIAVIHALVMDPSRDERLAHAVRPGRTVIDWNSSTIDFYRGLGADMLDEWTGCLVSGDLLDRLAERS